MADARARETWAHTASVVLWISENVRTCGNFKKPPKQLSWAEVYPYAKKEQPMQVPITALRDVFLRGKKKK